MLRSDDPCEIAITLIPSLPSAPNTVAAMPGVPRMRSPMAATTATGCSKISSTVSRCSSSSSVPLSALTTRGASAAVITKHMLFSEDACEIISTFACCSATTSNAFATMPGMPCIPVPLIVMRLTPRIDVTAFTPGMDGSPSTLTRVPGCVGLKLFRMRTGIRLRKAGRIVL